MNLMTLLAVSLLLSGPALALDPHKAITQYVHEVWGTDQGLPENRISAICQTRGGYLWLGTYAGVVRFDGVRFTVFEWANTPDGLKILSLSEDREGSLWIGTAGGGLNRLRDGKFTTFTTKDGLANDIVNSVCEDREGNLWIGTGGGGLTTKDGLSNNWVRSIYEDRDGSLWIGTNAGGLNRLRDGKFTAFVLSPATTLDSGTRRAPASRSRFSPASGKRGGSTGSRGWPRSGCSLALS